VYFNFTVKINSPNRNKNIQYRWEDSAKYEFGLDLSKDTLSVESSYNNNKYDFEEMTGERIRRRLLGVW
jgi:hypothetical protein